MSQKAVMWVTRASVDRYDPGLDFDVAFRAGVSWLSSYAQNEAPSTIALRAKFWQLSSEPKSGAEACRATPPIVPVARWKFFLLGIAGFQPTSRKTCRSLIFQVIQGGRKAAAWGHHF
jgi:hypothetical protein